jgi:hypothetical protein
MNRKRMSLVLASAVALGVAVLGWLVPLSRNSLAAPAPSSDASLKGKVLLVHTSNMMMGTFLLEKTHVQKMGEHSFLVGKGAAEGRMRAWYKERTVRLQMEHIVSITEFDDLKEAQKALQSGGGMPFGIGGYSGVDLPPAAAPQAVPVAPPPPAPPRKDP